MAISSSELKAYKSKVVTDTSSNGGRMSSQVITSDVKGNIFPDASQAERTAGGTKHRKVFMKVDNAFGDVCSNARVFLESNTQGGDSVTMFPASFTDTQSSLTGSERQYGCGRLSVAATAGGSTIQVQTEGVALNYLRNGDTIRISDKATIDSGSGNEEFNTINGVPSYSGDVATITLATPLLNSYATPANAKVSSVIAAASVAPVISSVVVTSGAGTFNHAGVPIVGDNMGSVTENVTLTFSSATAFTVTGDTLGALGAGTISADFAPTNPDFSRPYFTIDKDAFGGTFANGDTITFRIDPAAVPLWLKRIIPASTAAQAGNKFTIGIDCEST